MPDTGERRGVEHDAAAGNAVGRLLRDQREARGLTAEDVARALRIRLPFIQAIEQGRFEALPGAAYVPAFLRAYARHVDLEPEKVLTAYQLSGSTPVERPVTLPADFPLAERRAPIGLFVLTLLLVVGAGYGVWHFLPRQQTVVAEKVPPVPDRLLASRPAAIEPARTEPARSEVARAPASSAVTPAQPSTAPAPGAAAPGVADSGVAAPAIRPAAAPPAPAPAASPQTPQDNRAWPAPRQEAQVPPPPPPAVIAVPATPPAVISTPSAGQALAAQPPVVEQRTPANDPQEAVARPAPPAAPDAAAENAALMTAIPTRTDTQIVVRANSWVELRSPNGDVLAQTYVRAGESYVVPAGIAYRIIDAAR